MLLVTVQLFPHGQMERGEQIAQLIIFNDRMGDLDTGSYVGIVEPDTRPQGRAEWTIFNRQQATLDGFPRRKKHVWSLVTAMLIALGF